MPSSISTVASIGEPLKLYNFLMTIAPARGTGGADVQDLALRCQATQLPEMTNAATVVELQGYRVLYPGRAMFSNQWTTRFVEYTDVAVMQQIDSWARLCTDPTTQNTNPVNLVKSTATVQLLDGQQNVILTRKLVGIWPMNTPGFMMDGRSQDAVAFDIVWAYDYIPADVQGSGV